ncbi:MAG: potassium-transporting ATPase subunit KdpA [Actinobacteria bacterium]|nr:potassium-transporting ATPase subunit KdpA [Actinomycetota bacterium]
MAVVALIAWGMGTYMYRVFEGGHTFLDPIMVPLERGIYRFVGIDPDQEMRWTTYVFALLAVNLIGFIVLFILLEIQTVLPLNPAHQAHVPFWVGWNTAISFVTNTNWQAYAGEATLSYLSQAWLVVQQFLSPITGICLFLAVARGFSRQSSNTLGNFWRDFVRALLWISIPLAVIATIVLVALGSPQNLHPYTHVTTLQGLHQIIAQGPVASMTAIMQLGDNGGGFFNANAAHPFIAPNVVSLLFQLLLGFAVPAGCIYLFGKMIKDTRQSRAIFAAMAVLFLAGALIMYHFESAGNTVLTAHHITLASHANYEGKETRFGVGTTTLFNNSTTAISWGSVAASNDSMTPIGGMINLFNMMTGEVIFGSWGVGMIGMLAFAILAVFLAGLMVGRTPEYLGKKIEAYEVKMSVLAMVVPSFVILILAALSVSIAAGKAGIFNPGPHGLTEVLYAFSSGVGNNGSAFGGLNAASPWYAATVGIAMLLGRYAMYIPLVAIGGSLARKQHIPTSAGTFPTHGLLFIVLLVGTVLIVGALVFFPALALGPLAEQFAMNAGRLF